MRQGKDTLKKNIISKEKLLVRLTRQEAEMNRDIKKSQNELPKFESQSIDLDKKIMTLTKSVEEKALELQSKRSAIRTMAKNNTSKQEDLDLVTAKSKQMQSKVDAVIQENSEFGAHVASIGETIVSAKNRNSSLLETIEREVLINTEYKSRIASMRSEIQKINKSYQLDQGKMNEMSEQRKSYKEQLRYLTAKKESLLDGIESNTTAYYADKEAVRHMKSEINKVKAELAKMSNKKAKSANKATTGIVALIRSMEELNMVAKSEINSKKSQSVIINCVNEITKTMSENEFEQMYWTGKLGEGKASDGADTTQMTLNFNKMEMTHQDLKAILKPLIQSLGMRFKSYGLTITSKTSRKNDSDIVNALEMNLEIKKPVIQKQAQLDN